MNQDLEGLRDFDAELLSSRAKAKCESMSCFSSALSLSHTVQLLEATSCHAMC